MIYSKANELIQFHKTFRIILLSISIFILFNPSFVFGTKDNGNDNEIDKSIEKLSASQLIDMCEHMIKVKYLQENLDCDIYITQEIKMGLPTVSQNIKDFVKINQDGLEKLKNYTVNNDNDLSETDINAATDKNSIKDAKTLQDLTEEVRNMYYGEDILSDEAIEKRIDICEEMQSKDKLSIKTDCNEFVNTIDGVNVIADYVILQALDD